MKIGILTGGGDCPGLNAVIRAIVRKGIFHHNDQFVGFMEGWRGVLENITRPLDLEAVKGILPQGGTILRTSRTNPSKKENGLERCMENLKANGVEALIALGGDDTQSVSLKLFERGVKVVAVPKTIDNDLTGTDLCFGFDTAVSIATEAIDRVHTRLGASAVVGTRAMASVAILTAVSKAKQRSGPVRSLSMVLGTATTFTPRSKSFNETDCVSSPPSAINASTPFFFRLSMHRSMPFSFLEGFVREVRSIVPPCGRIPFTASRSSGRVMFSSTPRQPSIKPTNWSL